jgi:hypothetical protein
MPVSLTQQRQDEEEHQKMQAYFDACRYEADLKGCVGRNAGKHVISWDEWDEIVQKCRRKSRTVADNENCLAENYKDTLILRIC